MLGGHYRLKKQRETEYFARNAFPLFCLAICEMDNIEDEFPVCTARAVHQANVVSLSEINAPQ